MAEINTRIQLKHDTLAAWNSSTIALKYGEAAVAFVDTETVDAKGNIIHVPTALLKFGDATGTKTFKDLPFCSAPAVDVYAWGKAKDVVRNGKTLEFKKADGTVIHSVAFDYMTQSDVEGLLANYYTKDEIDGKVNAINKTITDLNVGDLVNRVSTVETAVNTTLPGLIAEKADAEETTAALAEKADISMLDNYTTTENQEKIDAEQDRRIKAIEDDYLVEADIANFETKENVQKVADALAEYEEANDAAVALKADKSVVDAMYTNSKIDELVQGAKDYADTNDANTEYHVEYDSTNKKIKLVAGADASKMEIDATDFIKDGMIDTVTIGDDNDLVITFNTAAGKDNIVLPLDQLVDIYTGHAGTTVTTEVTSDKKVKAEVNAGSLTTSHLAANAGIVKTQLSTEVQIILGRADAVWQGFEDKADKTQVATDIATAKQEAIDAAAGDATSKANTAETNAKGYADGLIANEVSRADGKYEEKGVAQGIVNALNLATTYEPIGAETRAIAAAKTETENQIKALNIEDYEKKANLKALAYKDKVSSDDFAEEVFIFNCGTSSTVI